MRRRTCTQQCPYCHKNDKTIISSSTQFYCKRCKRHFKENTTRKEYSKEVRLVVRALIDMFAIKIKYMSIKDFVKNVMEHLDFLIHDLHIYTIKMARQGKDSKHERTIKLQGNLKDSIIITRTSTRFRVIQGLDVYQKLEFQDYVIHTRKR